MLLVIIIPVMSAFLWYIMYIRFGLDSGLGCSCYMYPWPNESPPTTTKMVPVPNICFKLSQVVKVVHTSSWYSLSLLKPDPVTTIWPFIFSICVNVSSIKSNCDNAIKPRETCRTIVLAAVTKFVNSTTQLTNYLLWHHTRLQLLVCQNCCWNHIIWSWLQHSQPWFSHALRGLDKT